MKRTLMTVLHWNVFIQVRENGTTSHALTKSEVKHVNDYFHTYTKLLNQYLSLFDCVLDMKKNIQFDFFSLFLTEKYASKGTLLDTPDGTLNQGQP